MAYNQSLLENIRICTHCSFCPEGKKVKTKLNITESFFHTFHPHIHVHIEAPGSQWTLLAQIKLDNKHEWGNGLFLQTESFENLVQFLLPSMQKIERTHHSLCWSPVQKFLINLSHAALRNGWFNCLGEASERNDCHQLILQACVQTRLPQKRQKAKINTTISDERWPSLIGAIKIPVLKGDWVGLSPGICSHHS